MGVRPDYPYGRGGRRVIFTGATSDKLIISSLPTDRGTFRPLVRRIAHVEEPQMKKRGEMWLKGAK